MIASATIALGALKPAHLSGPALDSAGELHFAALGIGTATTTDLSMTPTFLTRAHRTTTITNGITRSKPSSVHR